MYFEYLPLPLNICLVNAELHTLAHDVVLSTMYINIYPLEVRISQWQAWQTCSEPIEIPSRPCIRWPWSCPAKHLKYLLESEGENSLSQ